ncbi:MAG: DUF1592 domain-containing protein, partial [Opitutales bacterium]
MIHFGPDKDFQLCLNIADTGNGGIAGPTSTPLAIWSLPDDGKKRTFTHEVWMDKRWAPWIGWENGPDDRTFRAEKLVEKYLPAAYFQRPDKKVDKTGHERWQFNLAKLLVKDGYKGPHLRIYSLTVEPFIETWPPQSHAALYGSGEGKETEIRQLMTTFAERAFRRPVTPELMEPYVQMVLKQQVEPIISLPEGIDDLKYQVYEGQWSNLPDFGKLEPVAKGNLPKGFIDLRISKRKVKYGMVFTGTVNAPKSGNYVFEIASDDRARILVDGKRVVEQQGFGYLGIQSGAAKGGVKIVRTVDGSPAQNGGLQANDVITHVDGHAYADPTDFRNKIGSYSAGDEVEIAYLRDNKEAKLKVKLAARKVDGPQLQAGSIKLEPGSHAIRVEYSAHGQPNSFRAGWGGAGMAHAKLSVDSLRETNKNKNNKKPDNEVPLLVRAMQDGYAAIMCSPQFLYMKEKPGRLDAFGIASRLSYFLWSSMPDEELFAAARSGKLNDPKERSRQVERMLKDTKAEAFVRHFPSAWLRLDKLGDMPPSGGDYQFYKNLKVEPMLA